MLRSLKMRSLAARYASNRGKFATLPVAGASILRYDIIKRWHNQLS